MKLDIYSTFEKDFKSIDGKPVSLESLKDFISIAPKCYKVYTIPKRKIGHRIIAQPSKQLKAYQQFLHTYLKDKFKVHHTAYAYQKNIDIKKNAELHKNNKFLLKMDFENFFNSINTTIFDDYLTRMNFEIDLDNLTALHNLVFWNPSKRYGGKLILSIGAPISPFISNCIMYFFDTTVFDKCKKLNITYSRYADDLTFTTNTQNILFEVPKIVKNILYKEFNNKIVFNDSKTIFSSKKYNRHITGITITNNGTISIGRNKKRYISSMVHKFSLGILSDDDILRLQGFLSFAFYIEPEFENRLVIKYSQSLINNVKNYRITNDE